MLNYTFVVEMSVGDLNPQLSLPFEVSKGYSILFPAHDSEDCMKELIKRAGSRYKRDVDFRIVGKKKYGS